MDLGGKATVGMLLTAVYQVAQNAQGTGFPEWFHPILITLRVSL